MQVPIAVYRLDSASGHYLVLEDGRTESGEVSAASLETDGDDGVSEVEEALRSPSSGICKAVSAGGGPSSAS